MEGKIASKITNVLKCVCLTSHDLRLCRCLLPDSLRTCMGVSASDWLYLTCNSGYLRSSLSILLDLIWLLGTRGVLLRPIRAARRSFASVPAGPPSWRPGRCRWGRRRSSSTGRRRAPPRASATPLEARAWLLPPSGGSSCRRTPSDSSGAAPTPPPPPGEGAGGRRKWNALRKYPWRSWSQQWPSVKCSL